MTKQGHAHASPTNFWSRLPDYECNYVRNKSDCRAPGAAVGGGVAAMVVGAGVATVVGGGVAGAVVGAVVLGAFVAVGAGVVVGGGAAAAHTHHCHAM